MTLLYSWHLGDLQARTAALSQVMDGDKAGSNHSTVIQHLPRTGMKIHSLWELHLFAASLVYICSTGEIFLPLVQRWTLGIRDGELHGPIFLKFEELCNIFILTILVLVSLTLRYKKTKSFIQRQLSHPSKCSSGSGFTQTF